MGRHYTEGFHRKKENYKIKKYFKLAFCNGNANEIRRISDDVVSNLARGPTCGFCHVVNK